MRSLRSAVAYAVAYAVALGLTAGPASAVSPKYFLHDTTEEFNRGETDGVSIEAEGSLRLAPSLTLLAEPEEPYLWDVAVDTGSGDIYLGTGDDGWVLRRHGDETKRFFQCAALEVLSVLVDGKGRLFAGTAPEGFVYRVDPDGTDRVLFDAEELYVWEMMFGPDGKIYAACGPRAVVYRIDPETGKSERFFEIDDNHAVSLAFDGAGNLIVGTEGRGLVVRVDPSGRAAVLHDTPQGEVGAVLAGDDGVVWAAAAASAEARESATGEDSADGTDPDESLDYSFRFTPPGADDGVLYRIDPDGSAVRFWESGQGAIFALARSATGEVLATTGEEGGLWSIAPDGGATKVLDIDAEQVVALEPDPKRGGHVLATSNPSRVFRLGAKIRGEGTYESEILDARRPARWGRLEWTGLGDGVSLSVRAGNTEEPDALWCDWSDAEKADAIGLEFLGRTRYLQWRLTLRGGADGPVVQRVRASALENNAAPLVSSVTIVPSGNRFYDDVPELRPRPLWQSLPGGVKVQYQFDNGAEQEFPPEQRSPWTQGLRQVRWEAIDPNEDGLQFELAYRREDETRWKKFAEEVEGKNFAFNSNGVPDGEYRIRVTASDEKYNADDPRTASRTSEIFVVDNTSPRFDAVKNQRDGDRVRILGTAADELSDIVRLEVSVNGDDWIDRRPVDGVFDSRSEKFEVTVDANRHEEHSIILRATDLGGNLGTTRILLRP